MKLLILLSSFFMAPAVLALEEISTLLVGTWGSSKDEGKTFFAFDEYSKAGEINSWGYVSAINSYFELRSLYRISGDDPYFNCVKIVRSSEQNIIKPGMQWCDEVIYIDHERFIYKSEDGRYNTLYRVSDFNLKNEQPSKEVQPEDKA